MLGKKNKEPKVEKVFGDKTENEETSNSGADAKSQEASNDDLEGFVDKSQIDDSNLTEAQKAKFEKLGNVRDKISKILQSSNIEIVDENFGDEYESESGGDNEKQQQQDYDSLKALFGSKDKAKTQELTLTIDDFDYTYTGQYIDEYDLMHMKGIKKIHLQRKHSKHFKKIIIAATLVVVLGLGGFLGYFLTRETPVYLKGVSLSQTEHDYYIYENFDYTGLYLITEYSDGRTGKVKLSSEYLVDIIGKVERQGDDIQFTGGSLAELTFNYGGFEVNYTVNIKTKTRQGISAIYADGLFELESGSYINDDYLKILLDYGDYGKEFISLSTSGLKISVDDVEYSYSTDPSNKKIGGFKLTQNITKSSKIVIKYSGIEFEFGYDKGANLVNSVSEQ
jgi:hypothetical protein